MRLRSRLHLQVDWQLYMYYCAMIAAPIVYAVTSVIAYQLYKELRAISQSRAYLQLHPCVRP